MDLWQTWCMRESEKLFKDVRFIQGPHNKFLIMKSKFEIFKNNIELIRKYESEGKTIAELAKIFNLNYLTVMRYLYKIGYKYKNSSIFNQVRKNKTVEEYLSSNLTNSKKRKYLIKNKIKEYKCEICGLTEWMGVPIPLELHHMDFNHHNNNLSNLQLLCPNCHAIIHNTKKTQVQEKVQENPIEKSNNKICAYCGKEYTSKYKNSKYCSIECSNKSQMKLNISKEQLELDMIELKSDLKISKKYNVSDVTIRNWRLKYNLYYK